MPADVTGVSIYVAAKGQFEFQPGPIFTDVLLADEINRAPAKTQAALLEGMQENQVSIDNTTHRLPEYFMVIATQNPIEYEGVYPLPEAQLDRFLMKVLVQYPEHDAERAMLLNMHRLGESIRNPATTLQPLLSKSELASLRRGVFDVEMDESVVDFVLNIIRESRELSLLSFGASPRAGVMLMQAAKASAVLMGKDFVSPEDVVALAAPVLRHRIQLTPEAQIEGMTPDSCIEALMRQVKVPR
jgi:MoxR-like ATPase